MKLSKALVAAVATSLITAPIAAQAATSPFGAARDGSEIEGEALGGGGFIIPLLAAVAVILGIVAATGGSNDRPTSP
ncbi:hypothetical protein [Altererythrobacter sp. Root672]|uniref:hypothetical protein n=1 Tax=Altererythrobacter sp. Root672 TaxID=1736584 RepID=UPI0007020E91|nr:hypothetical protein [Altererythrobacter sp. Root672]KRA83225.1 hypothetical protein ASD76_03955 [Altererythrobacter sp. Root672]